MLHHVFGSTIILDEVVAATVLPSEPNHFYHSPKLVGVTLQVRAFTAVRALNLKGWYFFVILILQRLLL